MKGASWLVARVRQNFLFSLVKYERFFSVTATAAAAAAAPAGPFSSSADSPFFIEFLGGTRSVVSISELPVIFLAHVDDSQTG